MGPCHSTNNKPFDPSKHGDCKELGEANTITTEKFGEALEKMEPDQKGVILIDVRPKDKFDALNTNMSEKISSKIKAVNIEKDNVEKFVNG